MRLFAEQGYEATTVDQIAAAAEISPSTFFRYFPTKYDVVLQDEYDAIMVAGLRDLPPQLPPLAAMRETVRRAFAQAGHEDRAKLLNRTKLVMAEPSLRPAIAENLFTTIDVVRAAVAERTGGDPDSVELRAFAGAVVGAMFGVIQLWADGDGSVDLAELADRALAVLGSGEFG